MPTQNPVQAKASFIVLASRDRYSTTRVWLPDEPTPIPAVQIGNQYHSFFRTTTKASEALELTAKLCDRNNTVVIIKTPKGYSLWVEEPEAMPQDLLGKATPFDMPTPSKILPQANGKEQFISLRVPDLDPPIPGINVEGQYYSVFRKESDMDAVLDIVAQLALRGDASVVISNQGSCTVCILETDAQPI